MSKITWEDAGEERVTAKSRLLTNLIARNSEKGLQPRYLLLHQKARGKPEKKVKLFWVRKLRCTIERWNLLFAVTAVTSSQEWKSDELMDDRTGRLVVCPHGGAPRHFVIEDDETNSYTEAESDLSLGSRSFLHRVNDQVRKRQKQSSMDATEDSEEHSVIWRMFMSSTLQAYLYSWTIKNTGKDLTMKQMFDISEKLVSEQSDVIYGVKTISLENSSWKYLSLIGDEQVISLQRTRVYVFRFCIVFWVRYTRTLAQT